MPEVTENNENANDIVQSNEFELQHSFTDWWLVQLTVGLEQPLHEDFEASDVEFETEFALIKREGDGIALSIQGGYEKSTIGQADALAFGPIVELASGKLLVTLNPLFTGQVGPNRETEGLGFDYGWRAEYDLVKHWGIGVEMLGEIEDLSNAGSFETNRTTASAQLCFGIPETTRTRATRRRERAITTTRRLPVLLEWSSPSTLAFSSVLRTQHPTRR